MEELIGEFKAESAAIIENLQSLLVTYDDSSAKARVAEELFRGVHTLKGTAKMFGFENVATVMHQLENTLDDHRKLNTAFDADLISLVLFTLDFCLQALEGSADDVLMQRVLERITAFVVIPANQSTKTGTSVYCILLRPDRDIFERGVNLAGVFNELSGLGTYQIFQSKKSKSIGEQVRERALSTEVFDLWLATEKSSDEVNDVFMFFKPHEFEVLPAMDENGIHSAFEKFGADRKKTLSKIERALRLEFYHAHAKQKTAPCSEGALPEESSAMAVSETPIVTPSKTASAKLSYINVPLARLDQMMNLVSEFITLTGEVKHYASLLSSDGLQAIAERLEKVSTSFRDNAFHMRLVPIQVLSARLHRYVKELAQTLGKNVRFITEGMETELDKSIINQIEGPLMHIIRNAMDHGLEAPAERSAKGKNAAGILKLSAFYSGTNVFIHIQDDGAGIDLEKVKAKARMLGLTGTGDVLSQQEAIGLIFRPGFSTAENITEISGRGVGMDVVQKNISDLRGSIEVTTEKGLGTSFAIRLPLALSVMEVIIVKVGELHYLIPHAEIEFCTSEKFSDQVQRMGYNLKYNNKLLPFLELATLFDVQYLEHDERSILILNKNDQHLSIGVDRIVGKEQVVIKPIDETLQIIPYLAGTSVLGNGELAFLIDVIKLKDLYAAGM